MPEGASQAPAGAPYTGRMDRPVLLYDGHCRFCVAQAARLQRATGGRMELLDFRAAGVLARFPQVDAAACERAMQLVQPDGRVLGGADAAREAIRLRPALRPVAWLMGLPGLRQLAAAGYRAVAANRYRLGGRVESCEDEACAAHVPPPPRPGPLSAPRALVRDLWLRLLGVIVAIAFLSLSVQVVPLVGAHGIMPAAEWMSRVDKVITSGQIAWTDLPTVFHWIAPSDAVLLWGARLGVLLGLLLAAGFWPRAMLLASWALYLSFVGVGQSFFNFQWDNLLLEATFWSLFVAPRGFYPRRAPPPSLAGNLAMLWLLFRLNVESGWAKWLGGDPHWHDLTAMVSYYETAPLPTWLGWWAHQLPVWAHQACTAFSLVVEGLVPLLLFGPRLLRLVAFWLILAMQTSIFLTGNYGFFNPLSMALCLWALDDGHVRTALRWLRRPAPAERPALLRPAWRALLPLAAVLFLGLLAATPFRVYFEDPEERLPGPPSAWQRLERDVDGFRTLNLYQLFVSLTLVRNEILIEGSRDGATWRPYVFAHKPGDPSRAPDFVAPHQPRLDFQFWFLALRDPQQIDPWFHDLLVKLVTEPALMARLFESTPCGDEAPAYLRWSVWRYHFTSLEERRRTGDWWTRDLLGQSSAETASSLAWKEGDPPPVPPQRSASSQDSKAEKPVAPR